MSSQNKANTFRFKELPAEIRQHIYKYALSLDFYDKHHERTTARRVSSPKKQCNALLIDRETSYEARDMIGKIPITLSYGLVGDEPIELALPVSDREFFIFQLTTAHRSESLENYFPASRIRNTPQLTNPDVGYRGLGSQILLSEAHFVGLAQLLRNAAELCRENHNLKSVLVSFRSGLVDSYLSQSPQSIVTQNWLFEVVSSLREIRNIGSGKVVLDLDIPTTVKTQLISNMELPPKGLLSLPKHVRQTIYRYALDFNDAIELTRNEPGTYTAATTPTMLLLNRQISAEATQCIREIPLVISDLPPVEFVDLTSYISLGTLSRIKHIRLDFQRSSQLISVVGDLVEAFQGGISSPYRHNLTSLELNYREPGLRKALQDSGDVYPPPRLAKSMLELGSLRAISEVKITGTLPKCFSVPIARNMMLACGDEHKPRYLDALRKTSSDFEDHIDDESEYDSEEHVDAPSTFKEYQDRENDGEHMPDYFWKEEWDNEFEHVYEGDMDLTDAQLKPGSYPED